jgi:hypothetical protein
VCIYCLLIWARRRGPPEYLWFAVATAALAVFDVGGALLADAESVPAAAAAQAVRMLGFAWTMLGLTCFAHALVGMRVRPVLVAGTIFAVPASALALLGWLFDPTRAAPPPTWGLAAAPDFHEPQVTLLGAGVLVVGWCFLAWTIFVFQSRASTDREARLMLVVGLANVAAGAHDLLVTVASLRSVYLVEHTALLACVAMMRVLLARFDRTSRALEERTQRLRRKYEELRDTASEHAHSEQLAAVQAISAVIARRVGDPLTAIREGSESLRSPDLTAEAEESIIKRVDAEVDRLNGLVDEILALPQAPDARLD